MTALILRQFPALRLVLEQNHPLTQELQALSEPGARGRGGEYFLVLALLPALCEELAFRGFILTGLLRGFREWTAILLSAFLFALYQMNFFQLVPHFLLGVVLGMLAVRAGSVLPAMLFHLTYNTLFIVPTLYPEVRKFFARLAESQTDASEPTLLRVLISASCAVAVGLGVYAVWRLGERRPDEGTAGQ
jgi:membrane protease YdiL (CAAX protease family)